MLPYINVSYIILYGNLSVLWYLLRAPNTLARYLSQECQSKMNDLISPTDAFFSTGDSINKRVGAINSVQWL